MSAVVDAGLLADVKNYLNITWDDDATDNKISGIILSGQTYLDSKHGDSADYLQAGLARTLLFEYARYMRDGALDVFENNYASMILAFQNERAVTSYVEGTIQGE